MTKHQKIRFYYHKYTVSAEDKGKVAEQRRLRDTFGHPTLSLRFDQLSSEWQVWDKMTSGLLYCITNIGRALNIAKAIYILRLRLQNPRQFWQATREARAVEQKRMHNHVDDVAREMAEGLYNHVTGKVSCTVLG